MLSSRVEVTERRWIYLVCTIEIKETGGKNEQSLSDLCKNDKKDLILNTLKGEENQNGT